jgi:hypothetical protein
LKDEYKNVIINSLPHRSGRRRQAARPSLRKRRKENKEKVKETLAPTENLNRKKGIQGLTNTANACIFTNHLLISPL